MKIRNQKGFAMISVVLLSSLLYAYSLSYMTTLVGETATIRAAENSLRAEAIAEAGAEEVMWEYNYGAGDFASADGWSTSGSTVTKIVNAFTDNSGATLGSYTTTITNFGASDALVSVSSTFGTSGSARTATLKLASTELSAYTRAITAKNTITLNGTNRVDSYDSTLGAYGGSNIANNGDVATNSTASPAVTIHGNNSVLGDVAAGAGATFQNNGNNNVTGTFTTGFSTNLPDNTVPSSLSSLSATNGPNSNTTLNAGNYKYSSWTLAGNKTINISGNVNIYVTGQMITNGNITIRVANGGSLSVYMGNNLTFNGQINLRMTSGVQIAESIKIFGLPGCTNVNLNGNGNSSITAVVNAPNALYQLNGTTDHYGSVIASTATLNGTGDLHYDESLGSAGGGGYQLGWARRSA